MFFAKFIIHLFCHLLSVHEGIIFALKAAQSLFSTSSKTTALLGYRYLKHILSLMGAILPPDLNVKV
jgi:hypothetical protein